MGRRGPAPKPTHLKIIEGTFRKDRAPANEPKPKPYVPTCPRWLGHEAKAEWRRIVPELMQLGLLTKIDRSALAAYCGAYEMWYEAKKSLDEAGTLVQVTESGYVAPRPEVGIINSALKTMKAFLAEFGMSPASRTRVNAESSPTKTEDPWAEFATGG